MRAGAAASGGGALFDGSACTMPDNAEVTNLLKQDHREISSLFKKFEGAGEGKRNQKKDVFRDIQQGLETHTMLEEEIFYPAVKRIDEEMIAESLQEHHVVDVLLKEAEGLAADGGEEFDAKMAVLMESVQHHVDEEEKNLFPKVEKEMDREERTHLGERITSRKEQLRRSARAA
ncbi:MAG TPA: hemerythrin domain-containing protein [Chloroflexota bacterium]|nr:hemerythrin domain-containing protein [Chloroflexota bacterium]